MTTAPCGNVELLVDRRDRREVPHGRACLNQLSVRATRSRRYSTLAACHCGASKLAAMSTMR